MPRAFRAALKIAIVPAARKSSGEFRRAFAHQIRNKREPGSERCRENCSFPCRCWGWLPGSWRTPAPSAAQTFVGTPVPPQFAGQGQALDQEWRMVDQWRRRAIQPLLAARSDQRLQLQQAEVAWRFKTDNLGPLSGIQARRHADHGQWRALHHRRHAPRGGRAGRQDRRADLGRTACTKASAPRSRRASFRAAACPTGPTARATTASST